MKVAKWSQIGPNQTKSGQLDQTGPNGAKWCQTWSNGAKWGKWGTQKFRVTAQKKAI